MPARNRPFSSRFFWPVLAVGFALLALVVMWWRWGGTVSDSAAYFDTARYFRGELPASALEPPFPYRLLVPALAGWLPGDIRNNFAALNWLAIAAAGCLIARAMERAGYDRGRAVLGGLLLIVSVPTFWYGPYLLVNPGSIFARSGFVLAVISGQPWLAAGWGLLGTGIREENILLLVWLVAARRLAVLPGVAFVLLAAAWLVVVRWWAFPGLPGYVWQPNLGRIGEALTDIRSLASLVAAAVIVVPLAIIGLRRAPPSVKPLRSLLALLALPVVYAALSVRVEGRVIWDLYPLLIPFALAALPAGRSVEGAKT
jgi:hypothetical protein